MREITILRVIVLYLSLSMPTKTKTPEIMTAPFIETAPQIIADVEKKKIEEKIEKETQEAKQESSVETAYHDKTFDSEVEELQKKVEANQITKEEAGKLYDEITKKYDKNISDKTSTVLEKTADNMGMIDKVSNKWNYKNTLLWTG